MCLWAIKGSAIPPALLPLPRGRLLLVEERHRLPKFIPLKGSAATFILLPILLSPLPGHEGHGLQEPHLFILDTLEEGRPFCLARDFASSAGREADSRKRAAAVQTRRRGLYYYYYYYYYY